MFLSACRFGLDRIDDLVYTLLRARFLISTRTVLYKNNHNIFDDTRENSILKRLGSGPLDERFVKELWTIIFTHSKHLQHVFLITRKQSVQ
jgi:chorismate mutase